jgi:pSer/pThr/pTyr-binding forkhead associated (FHA) protein
MSYLEIEGTRHNIPQGEAVIGSDASGFIALSGPGVVPRHILIQRSGEGQVAVRRAVEEAEVLINGVQLGPQPTPLLHGDKIELGGHELLFVDEQRGGSTQFVSADDIAKMASSGKPASQRKATAATGGRLVSLTDGREYTVSGLSLVIGRDASCDVVIVGEAVSRRHAEIMATPKGYILVDTSTNGTFVNGKRIPERQLLARADVLRIGSHEFRFYADVAPAAPAEPAAAQPAPKRPTAAPAGAEYRLGDTLHGIPVGPPKARAGGAAPGAAAAAPSPAAPKPDVPLGTLMVRNGPLKGQSFPIRVPVINVGRADYNDIVFQDPSVSSAHAKIQRRDGVWVLVDVGSTNGTFVDDERISGEVPLAPGAVIRFGDLAVVFDPRDEGAEEGRPGTEQMQALEVPPVSGAPPAQAPEGPPAGGAQTDRVDSADDRQGWRLWPFK